MGATRSVACFLAPLFNDRKILKRMVGCVCIPYWTKLNVYFATQTRAKVSQFKNMLQNIKKGLPTKNEFFFKSEERSWSLSLSWLCQIWYWSRGSYSQWSTSTLWYFYSICKLQIWSLDNWGDWISSISSRSKNWETHQRTWLKFRFQQCGNTRHVKKMKQRRKSECILFKPSANSYRKHFSKQQR